MVWLPTLSAPSLSFAPMRLDIAAPPPTPKPVASAISMKKKGKKKPTADRASGPSRETQMASTRL